MYRKMRMIAIAMAALAIMTANATQRVDTIKVINNAKQVVVTENSGDIRLRVNGLQNDDDYYYEYRVKQDHDAAITTTETEHKNVELKYPLKRCEYEDGSHFELFMSDVYVGWGRTNVETGAQPYIRNKAYEPESSTLWHWAISSTRTARVCRWVWGSTGRSMAPRTPICGLSTRRAK